MIVTLKGEAKVSQSSRAGIYVLGPALVNRRLHWRQDPGSNSIWYDKNGYWIIGSQNDLGTITGGIHSNYDVAGPHVATTWKYYGDDKWITSDDILVEPGTYYICSTYIKQKQVLPNLP